MKQIKITMYFSVDNVNKPVTYHLIKDFNLHVNILNADIGLNSKVGKLMMDITGEDEDIEAGLKFAEQQGVKYKLFTKSIIWNEEKCVHCGACTAVCPSGALHMDKSDWSLTFDKEKCMLCQLCVKACPLNVMNVIG